MADCVALAKEVAATVAAKHQLPVYLYEDAAVLPERRNRKTSGEGNSKGWPPRWPARVGRRLWPGCAAPLGGATVIGAAMPLIAYNITLATNRLDVGEEIAAARLAQHRRFPLRKAMGLALEDAASSSSR